MTGGIVYVRLTTDVDYLVFFPSVFVIIAIMWLHVIQVHLLFNISFAFRSIKTTTIVQTDILMMSTIFI